MSHQIEMFSESVEYDFHPKYLLSDLPSNEDLKGEKPEFDLLMSIKRYGVFQPILLKSGKVVAGVRRVKAARQFGYETIPAMIIKTDIPDSSSAILTISENTTRSRNPYGEYLAIRALMEAGYTQSEIANQTGLNIAQIKKLILLNELTDDLKMCFESGRMKASTAFSAAKLGKSEQKVLYENYLKSKKRKIAAADIKRIKAGRERYLPESLLDSPSLAGSEKPKEYNGTVKIVVKDGKFSVAENTSNVKIEVVFI